MTSTPTYGFRIGKNAGPMQTAIQAGNTQAIQQLLTKRFPGLQFQNLTSDEEVIAKPEETTAATPAPNVFATADKAATETTGDIYNNYLMGAPSFVRDLATTDYKGVRGSRLGRGNYTTESIVPGAQVALPSISDKVSEEEETKMPEVKPELTLSSFVGEGAEPGTIGAMGIGRAQGAGMTNEEILAKAQQEGLKFGEQAARGLGIQTTMKDYTNLGGQATEGAFGMSALTSARARGLSDTAIKALAQQQGLKFGAEAAKALGVGAAQTYTPPAPASQAWSGTPAPNYSSSASLNQYVGTGGGKSTPGAMGATAVGAAMAAGLTPAQIRSQAAAQGITFGPAAMAILK